VNWLASVGSFVKSQKKKGKKRQKRSLPSNVWFDEGRKGKRERRKGECKSNPRRGRKGGGRRGGPSNYTLAPVGEGGQRKKKMQESLPILLVTKGGRKKEKDPLLYAPSRRGGRSGERVKGGRKGLIPIETVHEEARDRKRGGPRDFVLSGTPRKRGGKRKKNL